MLIKKHTTVFKHISDDIFDKTFRLKELVEQ
jgi:hypothetical protein